MIHEAASNPGGDRSPEQGQSQSPFLIDCDSCAARGLACGDCVVTVLLGEAPGDVRLNDEERRAVEVLSAAGLVPPLRLEIPRMDPPSRSSHAPIHGIP